MALQETAGGIDVRLPASVEDRPVFFLRMGGAVALRGEQAQEAVGLDAEIRDRLEEQRTISAGVEDVVERDVERQPGRRVRLLVHPTEQRLHLGQSGGVHPRDRAA